MRENFEWIVIVGGSSALGKETATSALHQGLRVVLVDLVPAEGELAQDPRVTHITGNVVEANVIDKAFEACAGGISTSIVFVTSGRIELSGEGGTLKATDIQVNALFAWGSRLLKALSDQPGLKGSFFLISSVNSKLQSHSDPFYGALKAGAESLVKSLAVQANSIGRGAFLTLRLGFLDYPNGPDNVEESPSRTAARALLGKRQIAAWGDVAQVILSLHRLETEVLNGSTLWCDFGVHLLEQTHVIRSSLALGDSGTQYLHSP